MVQVSKPVTLFLYMMLYEANLRAGLCAPLKGHAINVATGKSISLKKLISNLEKELGLHVTEYRYLPQRSGDVLHSCADITRLNKLFTYRPPQ